MNITNFAYIVETNKNFDEAVVSVLKSIDKKGWALFQVYDIKERLAAKGFAHQNLKIIEICNAKHANNFISKNKLVSLCMPCKINVIEEKSAENKTKVKIVGMLPSMLVEMFPEITMQEALEVEKDIKEIVDNAK